MVSGDVIDVMSRWQTVACVWHMMCRVAACRVGCCNISAVKYVRTEGTMRPALGGYSHTNEDAYQIIYCIRLYGGSLLIVSSIVGLQQYALVQVNCSVLDGARPACHYHSHSVPQNDAESLSSLVKTLPFLQDGTLETSRLFQCRWMSLPCVGKSVSALA